MGVKKVLNVGGNNKSIPLPVQYAGYEHILLDIDPKGDPDIVCDARELASLEGDQFDAVYCSHNLEHYYRHDVSRVLGGFFHILKPSGFVQVLVPDLGEVMKICVEKGLDIEDELYRSPAGPIMVLDVLYGYGIEIERSGQDFYAHKTGFTHSSLKRALSSSGFSKIFCSTGNLEINAIAFKQEPDQETRELFHLQT